MKIIIAPTSVHESIQRELLKDQTTVFDVSILTLHAFKERFLNLAPNNLDMKIQAMTIISEMKHSCTVLSNALDYLDHQFSILTFALHCHHLDISYELLPQSNDKEQDIRRVCLALKPLFVHYDSMKEAVNALKDLDIHIMPHPASAIDTLLIHELLKSKATLYSFPSVQGEQRIHTALNPALEAHGIAQHVARHSHLTTSLLCADSSQFALLQHALRLYNVPFSTTIPQPSSMASSLMSVLEYILNPCREHFIELCKHTLLFQTHIPSLLKYIETFNVPFEALFNPFNHIQSVDLQSDLFKYDHADWIDLEKKAEEARSYVMSVLQSWSTSNPLEDIYNSIIHAPHLNSMDQKTLVHVKPWIETILTSSLTRHAQMKLLKYELQSLSLQPQSTTHQVSIHRLNDVFVTPCDQLIIMGASAKHYPPTHKNSGLIDEAYLAKITDYPSLSQRNQALVAYEHCLFTQAPLTILSYPGATMDGKPLEGSLSLKSYCANAHEQPWSVPRDALATHVKNPTITPSTSQRLFIKNGVVSGSVSSIEQFFNCSYQYFFERGLRLSKVQDGGLTVAHLGTMMHFVLEKWVDASMPPISESFIIHALENYNHDIYHCFPYQSTSHAVTFSLLVKSMLLTFERFEHYESITLFKPFESEHEINEIVSFEEGDLKFKGYIDRIDHHDDAFRIIDYKSTAKKIDKNKVLTGRQIQLFTYQMLYAKKSKLVPTGVHYYTLQNASLVAPPKYVQILTSAKKTALSVNNFDPKQYFIKNSKVNSVYINPNSSRHYHQDLDYYRFTSKGAVGVHYLYHDAHLQEALTAIFRSFMSRLKEGKIHKDPAEPSVCQYCTFQPICHFSGSYPKKPALYDGLILQKDINKALMNKEETQ